MGSTGLGLVSAAPGRPVQAVGDDVLVAVIEVEESADFGEGEGDKASMDGWRGFRFGRLVGSIGLLIELFGLVGPPFFLAWCAVTARKVWASMARVICRCQASQVRTW